MLDNKELQQHLSGYLPSSVELFINSYLNEKLSWHNYGEMYAESNSCRNTRWIDMAHEQLEIIQQKKLFDIQCLWRAGNFTTKEIEISFDFNLWEKYILDCPFIEPVSEDDIAAYTKYLLNLNEGDYPFTDCGIYQEHDQLKEAYNDSNGTFPCWYEYHNLMTGKNVLLQLQDIKGEMENFYCSLFREDRNNREREKYEKLEAERDKRPYLTYEEQEKLKKKIATKYENINTRYLYNEYTQGMNKHHRFDSNLEDEIDLLLNADEDIPITTGLNWRDATRIAGRNYICNKIVESLPEALNQYNLKRQLNISFYDDKIDYNDSLRMIFLELILAGRKLNNEPEDLNF